MRPATHVQMHASWLPDKLGLLLIALLASAIVFTYHTSGMDPSLMA